MTAASPHMAEGAPSFIDVAPRVPVEQNPLAALARAMRGNWIRAAGAGAALGSGLAVLGFLSGVELYGSQAILRVYPQEANILYRTGDDSVLKTFDSFVKAETSYVASHPVMERAARSLRLQYPDLTADMSAADLGSSIEIRRNDSLIVLNTKSRDAAFAPAKLEAVVTAYLDMKAETEAKRSEVRLSELQEREAQLTARQTEIRQRTLAVGGEFGIDALTKAHVEKVAQIDALSARRSEVEATLTALRAAAGTSSADMSDEEILRATLLDRALADLNFDRARRSAELATLITRYTPDAPQIRDKQQEIAVLERAMSERREQIKVLGQTGALTDTSGADPQASVDEIAALLDKVTAQLDLARAEARDLNHKRAELASLQEEAEDTRALLDDTRKALEIIRLEAGRALPGYSVVMSPPSRAPDPAEDSSKLNAVAGLAGGLMLALVVTLARGLTSSRLRWSDALTRWTHLVPVLRVLRASSIDPRGADLLRNALQLHPLRAPLIPGAARVIVVTRLDSGAADQMALALAQSFARANVRTLLIDADLRPDGLTRSLDMASRQGWREVLRGQKGQPIALPPFASLSILPAGIDTTVDAGSIGVAAIRDALATSGAGAEVVILNAGSLRDDPAAELLISAADLALAEVRPRDRTAVIAARIAQLDLLPRQGGAVAFTGARAGDPGLLP